MLVGRIGSKITSKLGDYSLRGSPYGLDEQLREENSLDIEDTLITLKSEIRSCKAYNDIII